MIMLTPYKVLEDTRGNFCGIINSGEWREINFLETRAGHVRGGHYHKETQELFYIIEGEAKVEVKDLAGNVTADFLAKENGIFIIEPNEIHTFTILADCKWINMLSRKMDETDNQIDIFTL